MVCLKTDALTETLSCAGLNGVREAGLTVSIVLLNSHPHPVFNPRYFLILEPYCGRVNVASNQLDRTVSVANKREVASKFGSKHKKNVGKHKHEQNSNWSIFQSSQSSTSKTSRCVHRDRLPYDKLMTLLGRQVMHCGHVARLQRMLHSWSVLLEGFFGRLLTICDSLSFSLSAWATLELCLDHMWPTGHDLNNPESTYNF